MPQHGSFSYAQAVGGALSGPDFSDFKQDAGHKGPITAGASLQAGNIGSSNFVFESKDLNRGRVNSFNAKTSTSLYDARSSSAMQPGMGA